jgi:hypothetical protein
MESIILRDAATSFTCAGIFLRGFVHYIYGLRQPGIYKERQLLTKVNYSLQLLM